MKEKWENVKIEYEEKLKNAQQLTVEKNYKEALCIIDEIIGKNPNHFHAYYQKSYIYFSEFKNENYKKYETYQKALENFRLAQKYSNKNEFNQAMSSQICGDFLFEIVDDLLDFKENIHESILQTEEWKEIYNSNFALKEENENIKKEKLNILNKLNDLNQKYEEQINEIQKKMENLEQSLHDKINHNVNRIDKKIHVNDKIYKACFEVLVEQNPKLLSNMLSITMSLRTSAILIENK